MKIEERKADPLLAAMVTSGSVEEMHAKLTGSLGGTVSTTSGSTEGARTELSGSLGENAQPDKPGLSIDAAFADMLKD